MQAQNDIVNNKIANYPKGAREKFEKIRSLIFKIAIENNLGEIEETLKWNEPAYLIKHGSTLRIDWKTKSPNSFYLFFNCKTLLIETFKEVFFDVLEFEGNRAIKLDLNSPLPIHELEQCVLVTLRYHKLKHLPLLGF